MATNVMYCDRIWLDALRCHDAGVDGDDAEDAVPILSDDVRNSDVILRRRRVESSPSQARDARGGDGRITGHPDRGKQHCFLAIPRPPWNPSELIGDASGHGNDGALYDFLGRQPDFVCPSTPPPFDPGIAAIDRVRKKTILCASKPYRNRQFRGTSQHYPNHDYPRRRH